MAKKKSKVNLNRHSGVMRCIFCGNTFRTLIDRCDGCGAREFVFAEQEPQMPGGGFDATSGSGCAWTDLRGKLQMIDPRGNTSG